MNQEVIDMNRSRGVFPAPGPARGAVAPRLARSDQPLLDWLDQHLLDAYQRDFPICETPFEEIARRLHREAGEVLRRLAALERCGVVSRVGPVFAPGCVGASTLAAMAVPRARLEPVAEWVSRYRAVSHLREREHEFNLWFVASAPNAGELYDTLVEIRRRTGLDVLDLRLERVYDIDLELQPWRRALAGRRPVAKGRGSPRRGRQLDASERRLVWAIQDGLSLTARPYAVVADRIGLSEARVMEGIRRLLGEGVITRMGVVVRDHEPGGRTSAMVAFDVPCARVDAVGERVARAAPATRCYRRIRRPPVWPYNLYCMVHGRDWAEVMGRVDELHLDVLGDLRHAVLFSRRRLCQRGAWHAPDHAPPSQEASKTVGSKEPASTIERPNGGFERPPTVQMSDGLAVRPHGF